MRPTIVELKDYYLIYSKGYWIEFHKETKKAELCSHADNLADAIRENVVIKKMSTSSKETREMLRTLAVVLRREEYKNDRWYSRSHSDEIAEYIVSHF